jgi:16S rRNA A1518/A1519 N6-dimethyltransferase RsmA/KsgA/DIM1 with predicted DNA glycosylase/AP lyase activity
MSKTSCHQRTLAQNFLKSSKLVRSLLSASSIAAGDIVYEIGPGRGRITKELAQIARNVIAIEKDSFLAEELCRRFQDVENVQVVSEDFLRYPVHHKQYKIFANIPYNITANIIRKILYTPPFPSEAYLVMQKEAAQKFSGNPFETQFSILAKPLFDIRIIRELSRTDFEPVPHVDSVLLRIEKRPSSLVQKEEISLYRSFVRYGFGAWKRSLKLSFKPIFTYPQWKYVAKHLYFPLDAAPSQLTFPQWLGLFECFKQRVPLYKQGYVQK